MIIKYDPIKPTDWLTPLEKVYARQSSQLDRFHSQLRERDRQEEAATYTAEKFNRDLSALGSLSATIKQISDARKVEHDTKETQAIENVLNTADKSEAFREIIEPYKFNKKGFNDDYKKLEQDLRKNTEFSIEDVDFLLTKSPRRLLLAKEIQGQRIVKGLPQAWNDAINSDPKWQDRYRKAVETNNTTAILALRKEFHNEKLANYKYSNGFLLENIKKENDRILNTGATLDKVKAKNIKLTTKEVQFEEDINTLIDTGTSEQLGDLASGYVLDKAFLASNAEAYETAVQQGAEKFVFTYEKFLLTSKDSHGDLEKILNSTVSHDGSSTGFTTFEKAYLNEDQVKRLTRAANEGIRIKWEAQKQATQTQQLKDFDKLTSGNTTVNEWTQTIHRLEHSPHADKELLKEYKQHHPDAQNQQAAIDSDANYLDLFKKGQLTSELIKNEPNHSVKTKWESIVEKQTLWDEDNKWEQELGIIKSDVTWMTRKRSLDLRETQTTEERWATDLIQEKANKLKAEKLLNVELTNVPNPNIDIEVKEEVEAWKLRNGWGTEDGPGLFSISRLDGQNFTFPNIASNIKTLNTTQYNYTLKNNNLVNNYNKNLRDFPDKNERHEKPNGIYSKELILGFSQNGYFNEEMKYIAAREGLLPGEALEKAITALEKGDEKDKKWLQRYNIKPVDKEPSPDVQIENSITKYLESIQATPTSNLNEVTVIKNIQHIMRWYGIDYLNMNQRKTIYSILEGVDPSGQVRRDAIVDSTILEEQQKEEQKIRRDAMANPQDTQIGRYNTRS